MKKNIYLITVLLGLTISSCEQNDEFKDTYQNSIQLENRDKQGVMDANELKYAKDTTDVTYLAHITMENIDNYFSTEEVVLIKKIAQKHKVTFFKKKDEKKIYPRLSSNIVDELMAIDLIYHTPTKEDDMTATGPRIKTRAEGGALGSHTQLATSVNVLSGSLKLYMHFGYSYKDKEIKDVNFTQELVVPTVVIGTSYFWVDRGSIAEGNGSQIDYYLRGAIKSRLDSGGVGIETELSTVNESGRISPYVGS